MNPHLATLLQEEDDSRAPCFLPRPHLDYQLGVLDEVPQGLLVPDPKLEHPPLLVPLQLLKNLVGRFAHKGWYYF